RLGLTCTESLASPHETSGTSASRSSKCSPCSGPPHCRAPSTDRRGDAHMIVTTAGSPWGLVTARATGPVVRDPWACVPRSPRGGHFVSLADSAGRASARLERACAACGHDRDDHARPVWVRVVQQALRSDPRDARRRCPCWHRYSSHLGRWC